MSYELAPLIHQIASLLPERGLELISRDDSPHQATREYRELATGDTLAIVSNAEPGRAGAAFARTSGASTYGVYADHFIGRRGVVCRKYALGATAGQIVEATIPHRPQQGLSASEASFLNMNPELRGTLGFKRASLQSGKRPRVERLGEVYGQRVLLSRDGRRLIVKQWIGRRWVTAGHIQLPPRPVWLAPGMVDLIDALKKCAASLRFTSPHQGATLLDWGMERILTGQTGLSALMVTLVGATLVASTLQV